MDGSELRVYSGKRELRVSLGIAALTLTAMHLPLGLVRLLPHSFIIKVLSGVITPLMLPGYIIASYGSVFHLNLTFAATVIASWMGYIVAWWVLLFAIRYCLKRPR